MKKAYKLFFVLIVFAVLIIPSYNVKADPTNSILDNMETEIKNNEQKVEETKKDETNKKKDTPSCNYVLGDPNEDGTVANMIQKFLNYAKVLAPLLVVLLSGFDFAKNALSGDQDEMKKATKKLGIRLACAVGVYLAPLLTGFLINFINNSSVDATCNIK